MSLRLVYTNKTVNFDTWCEQAQERFQFLGLPAFDQTRLNALHAYELGYTPDSWAREVSDSGKRTARIKSFKAHNPN